MPSTSRYYQLFANGNPDQTGAIPKVFSKVDNTQLPNIDPVEGTNQESWSPLTQSYPTNVFNTPARTNLHFQYSNDSKYLDYQKCKTKSKSKAGKPFCEFCKNNNEERSVYMSHVLKDLEGRVVCPVSLYKFSCSLMEANE